MDRPHPDGHLQRFGIGTGGGERHFYASHNHGGCENDAGWFVAATTQNTCSWESPSRGSGLLLLYSNAVGYTNWTSGNYALADSFAIFVR